MSTEVFTEETVSISAGNKTTLPKAARQRLSVTEGDKVSFKILSSGDVVVEKAKDE